MNIRSRLINCLYFNPTSKYLQPLGESNGSKLYVCSNTVNNYKLHTHIPHVFPRNYLANSFEQWHHDSRNRDHELPKDRQKSCNLRAPAEYYFRTIQTALEHWTFCTYHLQKLPQKAIFLICVNTEVEHVSFRNL